MIIERVMNKWLESNIIIFQEVYLISTRVLLIFIIV